MEFKLSKMPAFHLAFVFLPLQPLPLKSRTSNERTFDSSRVSSSQQQKCPGRPRVFCDQMGTVEQPLGHSHKWFKSRANDAQMGWQSGLHSRSNRLVMLSAQGGVILLFCQVSVTYHLTSLWAHVSTNYQFFSYLCAIACLKTTQPQVFAALLCDRLCRSSHPRLCWIHFCWFKFSIFFSVVSSTEFKLWSTTGRFERWRQTFLLLSAKPYCFWKALGISTGK